MTTLNELQMIENQCRSFVGSKASPSAAQVNSARLRQWCLDAGADDVGFVSVNRPELEKERSDILNVFPRTKTLISFVVRMNRESIRSPARSLANLEFLHTGEQVNDVARHIVKQLEAQGVRALNPSMGFPLEMDKFPGKFVWSHIRP